MNYYNEIKNELINNDINYDKTIGIIICKKENRFIMSIVVMKEYIILFIY